MVEASAAVRVEVHIDALEIATAAGTTLITPGCDVVVEFQPGGERYALNVLQTSYEAVRAKVLAQIGKPPE